MICCVYHNLSYLLFLEEKKKKPCSHILYLPSFLKHFFSHYNLLIFFLNLPKIEPKIFVLLFLLSSIIHFLPPGQSAISCLFSSVFLTNTKECLCSSEDSHNGHRDLSAHFKLHSSWLWDCLSLYSTWVLLPTGNTGSLAHIYIYICNFFFTLGIWDRIMVWEKNLRLVLIITYKNLSFPWPGTICQKHLYEILSVRALPKET